MLSGGEKIIYLGESDGEEVGVEVVGVLVGADIVGDFVGKLVGAGDVVASTKSENHKRENKTMIIVKIFILLTIFCARSVFSLQNFLLQGGIQSCGNLGDRLTSSAKCETAWQSTFICTEFLALVSYVQDTIGWFPYTYMFDGTQPIYDRDLNLIATNFSQLVKSMESFQATWTGTSEDGSLTSQNCFDWALNLDCFYGTISNLTNQACNQIFNVDCLCVQGRPITFTPTLSPVPSAQLPLVLNGPPAGRRRRLSYGGMTVYHKPLENLIRDGSNNPTDYTSVYSPSHTGNYDLDNKWYTSGDDNCIFEQIVNFVGYYLVFAPVESTKLFYLLPSSGNATGFSILAKKVTTDTFTLNSDKGPFKFYDSSQAANGSYISNCTVDWYQSSVPSAAPSHSPTLSPTTSKPTKTPTRSPTTSTPTRSPTTSKPSTTPTTSTPTHGPTLSPTTFCSTCPPGNETCVVLPYTNNCVGAFDLEFLLTWDIPDFDGYGMDMFVIDPNLKLADYNTQYDGPQEYNGWAFYDVPDYPPGKQPNGPENIYYSFKKTGHYPVNGNYTVCVQPNKFNNYTVENVTMRLIVKVDFFPLLDYTFTQQIYPLGNTTNDICAIPFGYYQGVQYVTTFEYIRPTPGPTKSPTSSPTGSPTQTPYTAFFVNFTTNGDFNFAVGDANEQCEIFGHTLGYTYGLNVAYIYGYNRALLQNTGRAVVGPTGIKIANDIASFRSNSLLVSFDAAGTNCNTSYNYFWTGLESDGSDSSVGHSCHGFTGLSGFGHVGNCNTTDPGWENSNATALLDCHQVAQFLCLWDPINTFAPTQSPSFSPTTATPSVSPTTSKPSTTPTTSKPSTTPTTSAPTKTPTTSVPTKTPSKAPTFSAPTRSPTQTPYVLYAAPSTTGNFNAVPGNGNVLCQARAAALGYSGGLSFEYGYGYDRSLLQNTGRAITGPPGTVIANDVTSFRSSSLLTTLSSAGVGCAFSFWSGLQSDGSDQTLGNSCQGFTTTSGNGIAGSCVTSGSTWESLGSSPCTSNIPILCIFDALHTFAPSQAPTTSTPTASPTLFPYTFFLTNQTYLANFNSVAGTANVRCQQDAASRGYSNGRTIAYIGGYDRTLVVDTGRAVVGPNGLTIATSMTNFRGSALVNSFFTAGVNCASTFTVFWTGLTATGADGSSCTTFSQVASGAGATALCGDTQGAWETTEGTGLISCSGGSLYQFGCLWDPVETFAPSQAPSTSKPTISPSTSTPSRSPTKSPSTSTPTWSPTITSNYNYVQYQYNGQSSNFAGAFYKLGFSSPTGSRSTTIQATGNPTTFFEYQATTAGIFFGQYQYTISTTGLIAMFFEMVTSTADTAGFNFNTIPAQFGTSGSYQTNDRYAFIGFPMLVPLNYYIRTESYGATQTITAAKTFMSLYYLSACTTCSYQTVDYTTTPTITTPTPTPTTIQASNFQWNSPTPLPTSTPTLITFNQANGGKMTIPTSGIWVIGVCGSYTSGALMIGITFNGFNWNDLDRNSWQQSTGQARTVGYTVGRQVQTVWTGYVAANEFVSIATTTPVSSGNNAVAFHYLGPSTSYSAELQVSGSFAYAIYRNSLIFNTTFRNTDVGFSAANFDQTTGIITFPATGVYVVSFWVVTNSNDPICVSVTLNVDGTLTPGSNSYTAETGRTLGTSCQLATPTPALGQYAQNIQVIVPITRAGSDYVQCIVESSNTGATISSIINKRKSGVSVVWVRPLFTAAPTRSPSGTPSRTPTWSPTITSNYNWVQYQYNGQSLNYAGSLDKLGFSAPTASRSTTIQMTATPSTAFEYQANTAGIYYGQFHYTITAAGFIVNQFVLTTSITDTSGNDNANTFPASMCVSGSYQAGDRYAFVSVAAYMPATYYIKPTGYGSISGQGVTAAKTFTSYYYLSACTTCSYQTANNPTTITVSQPTPTPVTIQAYNVQWNVPSPLPTSTPTLITFNPTGSLVTVPTSGIWIITAHGVDLNGNMMAITFNGFNWNDLDRNSWQQSTGQARTVAYSAGRQYSFYWCGYVQANEVVSVASSTSSPGALRLTFHYIAPSTSYSAEVPVSGSFAYASYRNSLIFNTTFRTTDVGFSTANFDQTTGKIMFPATGVYLISFWVVTNSNDPICAAITLNVDGTLTPGSNSFTSDTGRTLGISCQLIAISPALGQYAQSIQVLVPIIRTGSDYVQCIVESSNTGATISSLINKGKSGVSVVWVRPLFTNAPTRSPTTSAPTKSPSTSTPSAAPTTAPTYKYYQLSYASNSPTSGIYKMGYTTTTVGGRSQNSPITPVPSPTANYDFQVTQDGMYFVQIQSLQPTATTHDITLEVTAPPTPTAGISGALTSFPWAATRTYTSSYTEIPEFQSMLLLINNSYAIRAQSALNNAYDTSKSFLSAMLVSSSMTQNFYFLTTTGTANYLLIPTPAPSPSPLATYRIDWNPAALLPTSSPVVLTWDGTNRYATVSRNGYYTIRCTIWTTYTGLLFNSQLAAWETASWSATANTPRLIAPSCGTSTPLTYSGYMNAGEYVSCHGQSAGSFNTEFGVAYLPVTTANNYHIEVQASSTITYTSPTYRFGVIWSTAFRDQDVGFLTSYIDGTTGKFGFPVRGIWSINVWVRISSNSAFCLAILLNTDGTNALSTNSFTSASGRILGYSCSRADGTSGRSYRSLHVMFPITSYSDRIQIAVESTNTGENTASFLNATQSVLSLYKVSDL